MCRAKENENFLPLQCAEQEKRKFSAFAMCSAKKNENFLPSQCAARRKTKIFYLRSVQRENFLEKVPLHHTKTLSGHEKTKLKNTLSVFSLKLTLTMNTISEGKYRNKY